MSLGAIGQHHSLEEHFEGVRRFNKELIDLLGGGGVYSDEEILVHLNIDPSTLTSLKLFQSSSSSSRSMGL